MSECEIIIRLCVAGMCLAGALILVDWENMFKDPNYLHMDPNEGDE